MRVGITILLIALVLSSVFCGSTVTPERVGRVDEESQPEQPTQPAQKEEPAQPAEVPPTPLPEGPQAFNIGDVVSIGDSVLVVLGWEEIQGNEFAKPDEGNKFIAVDVLIVNQSNSSANISTMLQMTLKDKTAQQYNIDLLASSASEGGSVDGELLPGERVRGKVGFQIPQNAQGLQFVFDDNIFGTGKVFVDLGSQPISVEPPAEVAGETQQQVFNVGDIIEIGNFGLVVNEVTSPEGNEFAKPDEGNKFLVVDLTIENKTQDAVNISTLLQMSLKDQTGQTYDIDIMAMSASGGTSPDGELVAGEKVRGQVGFQVPVDTTGLVFVFDADVFGGGKVLVALP